MFVRLRIQCGSFGLLPYEPSDLCDLVHRSYHDQRHGHVQAYGPGAEALNEGTKLSVGEESTVCSAPGLSAMLFSNTGSRDAPMCTPTRWQLATGGTHSEMLRAKDPRRNMLRHDPSAFSRHENDAALENKELLISFLSPKESYKKLQD